MKAHLDKKVQGMRAQSMSFANDGIELSINVPDTADVKEVFGTVIDTVVDQQDEITRLNSTLERVTTENRAARQKLAQATTDKLQQLLTFQLQLEQQLFDAQKNIQNFAYNIQGYVDEHEDETDPSESTISTNVKIAKNLTLELGPATDETIDDNNKDDDSNTVQSNYSAALFPTEHGAPPGKMMAVQALTTSAFRSAARADSPARAARRRPSSFLEDDKFNYQMIPAFTLPSRENIRGRWRWALRKTLQSIRRKLMKVGLTRTRMNKQQTLIERLDCLDEQFFRLPQEFEERMQRNLAQLLGAVGEDLNSLKVAFQDHKLASDTKLLTQENQINHLKSSLADSESRLVASLAAQQKKNNEDNLEFTSQLTLLRHQLRDNELLKLDRFKHKYDDVSLALTELDHHASQLLTELKTAAGASESPPAATDAKSVTELLQQLLENDKEIQAFNTSTAMLEANAETMERALADLKQDLSGMTGHYTQRFVATQKYPILGTEEVSQLVDLLSRSKSIESHVKVVKEAVQIMKGVLNRHNNLLRETAQTVLTQAQQTLTTIPALTANLDEVSRNTQSLTQTVDNLGQEKSNLASALSALSEEQTAMKKLVDGNEQRMEAFDLAEMTRDLLVLKLQIGGVSRGSRPQTGGGGDDQGADDKPSEGGGNDAGDTTTAINNNFFSQGPSSGNGGNGGGISEQRVFEMISAALDGFVPSVQQAARGGGGVERLDSGVGGIIARAIEAANSSTSSQPVLANDDTFNGSNGPGSPSTRRGKMSRKASGGLHGSFVDYNARRSFIRNSVDQTTVVPSIFDPAPLLADIATLRSEATNLQKRLNLMDEEKPGKTAIEKICVEQIRDFKRREAKIDHKAMIEDMDVSLREMIQELVTLKKEQERFSGAIRVEFDSSLRSSLAQTKRDLLEATKESVISTKGLCLGCGRVSLVKTESSSRPQSPSFLPALSAHSLPGPDVMRGGFKIPVRTSSPPLHYDPALQPQQQFQQSNGIPLLMKGRVQTAPASNGQRRSHPQQEDDGFMSPQVSSAAIIHQVRSGSSPDKAAAAPAIDGEGSALRVGFTDFDDDDAGPMLSMPVLPATYFEINSNSITSLGNTDKPLMVKEQRGVQLRTNSGNGNRVAAVVRGGDEMLRPLYRRGFPAKKNNLRAETSHAPDRFDLALSNSTSNLSHIGSGRTTLHLPTSVKPLSAPGGNR